MEVVEAHRKYLGFDGPYVFSKLMRPLVKLWRSKGLKAVMYPDNGICAVKGKIEAKKWVRNALECAGLVVHEGKSVWLSTAWLGFDADLERGGVLVPEAKLAVLRGVQRELELWRSSSVWPNIMPSLYGLALQPLGWCE